jgi:hypothetical protein
MPIIRLKLDIGKIPSINTVQRRVLVASALRTVLAENTAELAVNADAIFDEAHFG